MSSDRSRRFWVLLDRASSIAIVVTCGLLLWSTLVAKTPSHSASSQAADGPTIGRKLELPATLSEKKRAVVLVAVKPGCRFCSASSAFYQHLEEVLTAQQSPLLAVAVDTHVPTDAGVDYVTQSLGLKTSPVALDFARAGLRGTPTLVMLDQQGIVLQRWIGQLPPAEEAKVLDFLKHNDQ